MVTTSSQCSLIAIIVILNASLIFSQEIEARSTRSYAGESKDLRYLAQIDFELLTELKSFKEKFKAHGMKPSSTLISIVDTYVNSFSNSTTTGQDLTAINSTEHEAEILRNPLAMFTVIHRFTSFLRSLKALSDLDGIIAGLAPIMVKVNKKFASGSYDLRTDLAVVVQGILQIQFTYNVKAADLAQGIVHGIRTRTKLGAVHCFYIGVVAKRWKKYTLAVEWLLEAKRLTVDIPTANAELVETIKLHDELLPQRKFTSLYFFMKPLKSLESVTQEDQVTPPREKQILQNKYAGQGRNVSFWPVNVCSLCSGRNLNTPAEASHLFCWNEFKLNKALTFGPLKMEFLSRNPDIVQIHDAFSNAQVAEISASNDFPSSDRTERKLEILTGLALSKSQTASDPIEVLSHLPGGHTDIHVDSQNLSDSTTGDRIVTVMINLNNNVEKGGYTVFPAAFATAVPSKGSAVFWFNLFSDGTPDLSTAHEDCPVILGQKLTAYKWVRYYDQFNVRKCLLQPKERFQVLVNGKALPVPRTLRHENIEKEEFHGAKPLSLAATEAPSSLQDIPVMKYAQAPSSNLKALLQLEWEIYQNIKRMFSPVKVTANHGNLGAVQLLLLHYLTDFNETAYNSILQLQTSGIATNEAMSQLSWNPLAVYRTLWRFENYIKPLLRLPAAADVGKTREVRDYLRQAYNETDGPLRRDLEDTMSGILITQFVHDLKSQDIAQGLMAGIDTGIVLSAKQCIEIGRHAIVKNHFYQAINWMETALDKVTSQSDATVTRAEVEIERETAIKVHNKLLATFAKLVPTFYTTSVSGRNNFTGMETRKEALYNQYRLRTEMQYNDLNLAGLCQGRQHQTIQDRSKLFCWQEHQIHPYFKLRPLHAELLSMHPKTEVVIYHNVLSQRLLEFLRNDSGKSYSICSTLPNGDTDSKRAVAATSMVYRNDSQDALSILKLSGIIAGLNAVKRGIMVHSYAPGGHNAAHADANSYEETPGNEEGNGVGTLMFFVKEPQKGGMTAFAQAGVQIPPKAGSAVFWYNTLSSGDLDTMSYHAGCPVIFGLKGVATVLMSYVYQNHLKCSKDPMRRLEVLINGKSKYGYD